MRKSKQRNTPIKVRSHILSPFVARGIVILCAAAFILGAHIAQAVINVWTSNGPGTPAITALAIDPITPRTLYAGTLYSGAAKSTDCPHGLPSGAVVDVTMIIQAVDNTLNRCGDRTIRGI